jgi:hypothetical protein
VGRLRETLVDPNDTKQIAEVVTELQRVVDREIEFGNPADPTDDESSARAGLSATAHPGTLMNIKGAWVEIQLDTSIALDTEIVCHHNLNLIVADPSGTEPNVRWIVMGIMQSSGGPGGTDAVVSVSHEEGDTVDTDSIGLRVHANNRTVNDANPLKVSLFIIPAVRWPEDV